jgi:hypothetical protein
MNHDPCCTGSLTLPLHLLALSLSLQFLLINWFRADNPNASTEVQATLASYQPDSSTVLTRKGDLLTLGDLVLPADGNITAAQINGTAAGDGATLPGGALEEAQKQQQELLDRINQPESAAANDTEVEQTLGAAWVPPEPKMPSGGCRGWVGRTEVRVVTIFLSNSTVNQR